MRYLYPYILKDLDRRKMVFIGGPRQVGKTTLSWAFLGEGVGEEHPAYLNWEDPENAKAILEGRFPKDQGLLIFDEIHKYQKWRGFLKGYYDKNFSRKKIIVTGSARLDSYRHGGDSLMGRYFFYRLHPLSLGEIPVLNTEEAVNRLFHWGGFPEPFYANDQEFAKRWRMTRRKRVLEEDLIMLERVQEVRQLALLMSLLPDRIGSLLSQRSLGEDLSVSHSTIGRWLEMLDSLYYTFRISPWTPQSTLVKAMKKDKKGYLWDWSACQDEAVRFENMVASLLLKYVQFKEDTAGDELTLHYLRDKEKREIDFIVAEREKPLFAVECKLEKRPLSPNIPYFADRTNIPIFYQVSLSGDFDEEIVDKRARIISYAAFSKKVLHL